MAVKNLDGTGVRSSLPVPLVTAIGTDLSRRETELVLRCWWIFYLGRRDL